MIIPERRKAVSSIMSRFGDKEKMPKMMSSGGELEKVGESPEPDMSALHTHMQQMISSIHNKDPKAASQHLMNFIEEHKLHQEEPKEEEESTEAEKPSEDS